MSNHKYICIHGHFYQPPRENPWLNDVEVQDSAYPFHDWNERVTAECYSRNSAARILEENGRIEEIVNNYSRISFNFGPTLLHWMKLRAPEVYEAILQADKDSQKRFGGHGSAMAQSYNHLIMPLANERDKETQVLWGIRDFESRFERKPEGMWLSETAVNTDTLEVLARHGIKFTILSPYQAKSVRKIGTEKWTDVVGAKVDPRRPYVYKLPSGRTINLFFYDGPVSQGIAFEGLLNNGKVFADRLTGQLDLDDETDTPQLMHIATDGETYGHHHRLGEMGLSYCLHYIEKHDLANITVYGEYLEKFPPEYEAKILENTAWSSTPNLERWMDEGGGNTGGHPDWNQQWRKPLRKAFDWLRDELIPVYEQEMGKFATDPWKVRNDYINIILDRSPEHLEAFAMKHCNRKLSKDETIRFLKLLEIQHHTMLMYTSCGWFFDEVTGIETMQDILYAARAIQLARDITRHDLEPEFLEMLKLVPSNLPEYGNAANAYNKFVKPSIVDIHRVGAHYAVSSLFTEYPEQSKIYSFGVKSEYFETFEAGKQSLAIGKALLTSEVTLEEETIAFAVLHLGDHHLFGGVRQFGSDEDFMAMRDEIVEAFQKSRVHEAIVLMDKHYGTHNYSFWHLFKDDQKKILNMVLSQTMSNIEVAFRQIYENNYPVLQAMKELSIEPPRALKYTGDYTVSLDLERIIQQEDIDVRELRQIAVSITNLSVEVDRVRLNYMVEVRINAMMERFNAQPKDLLLMENIIKYIRAVKEVQLTPDLWRAQNLAFLIHKQHYKAQVEARNLDDQEAKKWLDLIADIFYELNIKVAEDSLIPSA